MVVNVVKGEGAKARSLGGGERGSRADKARGRPPQPRNEGVGD